MTDDPIGDALHADAQAARAELRALGFTCPTCGVNMADTPAGHRFTLDMEKGTATCSGSSGMPLPDASFEWFRTAASIALFDEFRERGAEVFQREFIGTGDSKGFTGFLDLLGDA